MSDRERPEPVPVPVPAPVPIPVAPTEEMRAPEEPSSHQHPPHVKSPPLTRAAIPAPAVEPPSADVAPVESESGIPGAHRGGFERWPTAPIGVTESSGPVEPSTDTLVQWAPLEPRAAARGMAAWALGFAIVALVVSMFVGWGFLLGLVAIVAAIIALRRPLESRAVAIWALVLGAVSVLYSAGWLWWAASRTDLLH